MSIIERSTNANVRTRKWLYEQLVKLEEAILGSSSGSSVTTLTLEEFGTLVTGEGIEVGKTYVISDASYGPLIGYSSTVVKPIGGSLTILNGDTLPTGIEPDVLFIDTGVIDYDISQITGTPLALSIPVGYIPIMYNGTATGGYSSEVAIWDTEGNQPFGNSVVLGKSITSKYIMQDMYENYYLTILSAEGVGGGITMQLIIEFQKSKF